MQEKSEKITGIKEKLLYFIDTQGITKEDFYKKIDIDGANFRGKNKKSELSTDKIVKILRQFPQLSPDWLLLDTGEMLRSANGVVSDNEIIQAYKATIEAQQKTIRSLEHQVDLLEDKLNDEIRGGGGEAASMAG